MSNLINHHGGKCLLFFKIDFCSCGEMRSIGPHERTTELFSFSIQLEKKKGLNIILGINHSENHRLDFLMINLNSNPSTRCNCVLFGPGACVLVCGLTIRTCGEAITERKRISLFFVFCLPVMER